MGRQIVERIKVWDGFVRTHHWALVALVLGNAWLFDGGGVAHRWIGYIALGLVTARLVWSVTGTPHARFGASLPTPARVRTYLATPRCATRGHNPLGTAMAIWMLMLVATLGISGWLMATDRYWGEAWLEDLHKTLSNVLLACAAIHLGAVLVVSVRTRINLPRAMLTGWKERGPNSPPFE
jgi:cytochrome b